MIANYKVYDGDVLGDVVQGLVTRMAPNIAPIVKQLSIKAIEVIRDKGISGVGDVAGKAFDDNKNHHQ